MVTHAGFMQSLVNGDLCGLLAVVGEW